MSEAVRVTHYKVVREMGKNEPNLTCEPSSGRLYSADWQPVGWIQGS